MWRNGRERVTLWGTMNPIFRREFVARWRDWRSHLLLLVVAAVLGLAAYVSYSSALSVEPMNTAIYPAHAIMETLATRSSRAGHALFQVLAIGNVAVCFVLAPLLCATGVARERERGLLENLQLSPMTARSQVWARAVSAMLYLGAVQLATLPIYFVAFSFGGVSPLEIGSAWLVALGAAWCGVGLGLSLSAASHRPSSALFGAVALVFGWSVVALYGLDGASSPYGLFGLASGTNATPLTFCQLLYYSHPVAVVMQLLDPSTLRPPTLNGPLATSVYKLANGKTGTSTWNTTFIPVYWKAAQVLPLALASWFLVGALGLAKAARDVTRAFAPSGWAGRNPLVEAWKKRRAAQLENRRARASARVSGALLADLPFDKWIHFKNPLLNREVKSRFRLRQTSAPMWFVRAALFLGAASAWIFLSMAATDSIGRSEGAPLVLGVELILGALLVGTWAASGFAREREAGTWEGMRLSLLRDGDIARTKWASPLLAFGILTTPMWLLLFAFAPIGSWDGTPLRVLLAGGLMVASSLCFISALGSWISLRARSSTAATCCTLGALLLVFVGVPALWGASGMTEWSVRQIAGVPLPSRFASSQLEENARWRNDANVLTRYAEENPDASSPARFSFVQGVQYELADDSQRYNQWCQAKEEQAKRVQWLSNAWSPLLVLADYQSVQSVRDNQDERETAFVMDGPHPCRPMRRRDCVFAWQRDAAIEGAFGLGANRAPPVIGNPILCPMYEVGA